MSVLAMVKQGWIISAVLLEQLDSFQLTPNGYLMNRNCSDFHDDDSSKNYVISVWRKNNTV